MEPTRRQFLTVLGTGGVAAGASLGTPAPAEAAVPAPKTAEPSQTSRT
jgi:hypothetical protein